MNVNYKSVFKSINYKITVIVIGIILIVNYVYQSREHDDNNTITSIAKIGTQFTNYNVAKAKVYTKNTFYMVNNNVAQFSSYIIVDSTKQAFEVEGYIQFNYKFRKATELEPKENFTCLLKMTNMKYYTTSEEIISIEADRAPRMYWNPNKKLMFLL